MIYISFFIFCLFEADTFAYQKISADYWSGPYLIYDCSAKHWACVSSVSFDNCILREKGALKSDHPKLDCYAFKGFESERECEFKQMELVLLSPPTFFCAHPVYGH